MSKLNEKLRIRIIKLGYFPFFIDTRRIENWKSEIFEVFSFNERETIRTLKKGEQYDDAYLSQEVNRAISIKNSDINFTFVISNISLQDHWYSRILSENIVIFSYKDVIEYLRENSIPLENAVIMLLYTYSLFYRKNGRIPNTTEEEEFLHSDTRGCIFDLSSEYDEIIYSCVTPIICHECQEKFSALTNDVIRHATKELKRIKKTPTQRIVDVISKRPYLSALLAVFLPVSLTRISTVFLINLPNWLNWMLIISPLLLLFVVFILTTLIKDK